MTGLSDKIRYFGYEPANYIIKVYPNVAYLSIYLSALEDILIMIIYLLTGQPDARKTHTQPGFLFRSPEFIKIWWKILLYCLF